MNNKVISVTKRDGRSEPINLDKIHRVLEWATEGISGVSISEIEIKAQINLYNGIKAYDIHQMLIKSASELISEDTPNYQFVAARLINYKLRKEVYGQFEPMPLADFVNSMVEKGYYSPDLISKYSDTELEKLNSYLDHERDWLFAFAGMEQMKNKYIIRDKINDTPFETPQMVYMAVSMTLFMNEEKEKRLSYIKEFYDMVSQFYVSLPTPIMAGCRTPIRQFSSCVLIDCDDSLDGINETASTIVSYVSKKAGIGINAGAIRAEGSYVGADKSIIHTGVVPFLKYFQSALHSCSQGGTRNGAATVNFPIWHYEFSDLIVLKNNKGTEETRVRHMDYVFQLNEFFYKRLLEGGDITFFSPHEVPDLLNAFYSDDNALFEELYTKYEKSRSIRKKKLPAIEVFSTLMKERKETSRIYIMNIDHCNSHSAFEAAIKQTNLCCEITLPTEPVLRSNHNAGEVALCTLAAVNWGKISKPEDFERPCSILVRALDNLLSYQEYMHPAAEKATMKYRPLGIGIINLAYFLANNDIQYGKSGLPMVDEYAEAWSYYLIKASNDLIKEGREVPSGKDKMLYCRGVMPIDTYKSDVDNLCPPNFKMDWETLRKDLKEYGIRNATLMALMPSETSSQLSNATNGIEPPRALVSYKISKSNLSAQVVPSVLHLKNKYHMAWDLDTKDYLETVGVLQKYIDQAISANTYYNPMNFENGELPMSLLIEDLLYAYKLGIKTLYYHNTKPKSDEDLTETPKNDCGDVCTI